MDKIILQSTKDVKKQRALVCITLVILAVAVFSLTMAFTQYNDPSNWHSRKYYTDFHTGTSVWQIPVEDRWPDRELYMFPGFIIAVLGFGVFAKNLLFLLVTAKNVLTVTETTIRGIAKPGKNIEIPVDKITSISESKKTSAVIVATASGKQSFHWLENYEQICKEIQNLIAEQKSKMNTPVQTTIMQEVPQSNADELKKFKELLDSGVISQEEFDAKKKQLLGL